MMQMEKYWVNGNTYLIWDPIRNQMELTERRILEIRKGSLTFGAEGIIYGPYVEDHRVQYRFFSFDEQETEQTVDIKRVFRQYLADQNYDIYKNAGYHKSMVHKQADLKGQDRESVSAEKGRLRAIGYVYVNERLITDAGSSATLKRRQIV